MEHQGEQRTYERYDSTIAAKMLVVDPSERDSSILSMPVKISNFSLGGMRLQTGPLSPEMARELELGRYGVVIRFAAGRRQLEVHGQVRWIDAGAESSELGLRHINIDPQTAQRLFDLIGRRGTSRSYRRLRQAAPWVVALGLLICWRFEARRQRGFSPQRQTAVLHQERGNMRAPRSRGEELLGGEAKRAVVRTAMLSNVPFALQIRDSHGSHTALAQPVRLSYEGGVLSGTLLRTNTAVGSPATVQLELQAIDPRGRSREADAARRCEPLNLRFDRENRARFDCEIELWPAGYVLMTLRQ